MIMSDTDVSLTAYEIPLIAISNQRLNVTLNKQSCTIAIYQRGDRLYLDLNIGTEKIRTGCLCIPYAPIVTGDTDFLGQLYIADTYSPANDQQTPVYSGLGERYKLYYLPPAQVETLESVKYELSEA